MSAVLVHLASGIGNIVFATPLLAVLRRNGFVVDVLVDGDYVDVPELFAGWNIIRRAYNGRKHESPVASYDCVLPAIPPFYWNRFAARYHARSDCARRPPDALFYHDEQQYYLQFASAIGCDVSAAPYYFLPVPSAKCDGVGSRTVVLAPGCKTGEMAAKRWPFFAELADMFDDIVLVGTADDLTRFDGTTMRFPRHVRSLVGRLSLAETAAVLANAGAVVANDSGLGHVAGAVGTPTILLFGPTPHTALGRFPRNVTIVRTALPCEPCWLSSRLRACRGGIDCLRGIAPEHVQRLVVERTALLS